MRGKGRRLVVGLMVAAAVAASAQAQQQQPIQGGEAPNIYNGVLSNVGNSRELSTGELRQILMDSSAIVVDARPYEEYAVSHIPAPDRSGENRVRQRRCTSPMPARSWKTCRTGTKRLSCIAMVSIAAAANALPTS